MTIFHLIIYSAVFYMFALTIKIQTRANRCAQVATKVIDEPSSENVEKLIMIVGMGKHVAQTPDQWNRIRNAFVEANKSQAVAYERKEALRKALMRAGLRGIDNTPIIKTRADLERATAPRSAAAAAPRGLTASDADAAKQHLNKAERIIDIDPEAAMNYCRKFLESATKGLLEANGIVVSRENNLFERIVMIENSGLAEQKLCSLLHRIRTVTNKYSHTGDTDDSDDGSPMVQTEQEILDEALEIVSQCHEILHELLQ